MCSVRPVAAASIQASPMPNTPLGRCRFILPASQPVRWVCNADHDCWFRVEVCASILEKGLSRSFTHRSDGKPAAKDRTRRPCVAPAPHLNPCRCRAALDQGARCKSAARGDLMYIDLYSDRAKQAIQSAQSLALARRHQQLAPEHILKVLLEEKDGLARALIQSAGGRPDQADTAVEALLAKMPKVEAVSYT